MKGQGQGQVSGQLEIWDDGTKSGGRSNERLLKGI